MWRKLLPTKRQFENWTLPSKHTFIGVIGTLVGIVLAVFFGVIPLIQSCFAPDVAEKSDINRLIEGLVEINRDRLDREYPDGYALFRVSAKNLRQIRRELVDFPENSIANINWSASKIFHFSRERIKISLPEIEIPSQGVMLSNTSMSMGRIKGHKYEVMTLGDMNVGAEVLIDEEEYVVLLIGMRREL